VDEPRWATPPVEGMLGTTDLGARLERWVAEARSADAAAAKARARWMRVQSEESATFGGVLIDLAERAAPVVVHTRAGRRHHGVIVVVAVDFCALRTVGGHEVLVAYRGIASVRPDADGPGPSGDRLVPAEVALAEMLSIVNGDRPRVLVLTTVDDEGVAGELRSVGRDVITLRLDGGSRAPVYVPIDTITEVVLV
jgi:hypothetical protein